MSLQSFFEPTTVAVIGASADPAKLGHIVLQNIIDGGYAGELYAVNPKGELILDIPTYTDIRKIPDPVDLAVIAVPAGSVNEVVESCGAAAVKGIIVISAGFSEEGGEGSVREQRLREITGRYGIRILGPNCLGLIDTGHKLNASFAGAMPPRGPIAVVSQSGAICTAILDWAKETNLGFSSFVSVGNKLDVSESDLLQTWKDDDDTSVILGYLEGITDGPKFMEAAGGLTRRKPFILIKAGTSAAGEAAVSSHTGTLTGSDDVLNAVLARTGVTRAETIEQVFDFASTFATAPLPKGSRVAIVTNAGGVGVLTTDAVAGCGLAMAELGKKTQSLLRKALPEEANVHNPVDCIGDARAGRYQTALSIVLKDTGVDAVIVLLTPQAMTEVEATADVIVSAQKNTDKPILSAFIGGAGVRPGLRILADNEAVGFGTPERAVRSLAALVGYAEYRREPRRPAPTQPKASKDSEKRFRTAMTHNQQAIVGPQALALLEPYGIVGPPVAHAPSIDEAVKAAEKLGYPLVMKIDSPDVLHKTDAGGVALGLRDAEEIRQSYTSMLKAVKKHVPDALVHGVELYPEVKPGPDFLVGGSRDVTFGPVVTFGFGGIYVETFQDVACEVAPLDDDQARALIHRTKASAILAGARGGEVLDTEALVKAVIGVSRVMHDFPDISELDLNPIRVYQKGALSLDTRIILKA